MSSVVDLLLADPALTARVVVAFNTPFYSRGEPTADIRDAVLRLGLNEVSRIVQIVALTDRRKYPTHLYSVTAGHFWERSLHSACALADWYYGVKNEKTLQRSDLTITDVEVASSALRFAATPAPVVWRARRTGPIAPSDSDRVNRRT